MNRKSHHVAVFGLLLLLWVVQIALYGPRLPDPVGSHFHLDGTADGCSSRSSFILYYGGLYAFVALVFFVITVVIKRIPSCLISIPYKDYWLSPERREVTLGFLSDRLLAMSNATLCLLLGVFQVTILANLSAEAGFVAAANWVLIGGYLIYNLFWMVQLFAKLRRPQKE